MVTTNTVPFILTPFQNHASTDDCGYCLLAPKSPPAGVTAPPENAGVPGKPIHYSIGSQVIVMSCEDYEKCMNMGFRRSGTFIYKGDMLRGCCRMYTIRTNLQMMKITKEHRQVVNRFKRAIADVPDAPDVTNVPDASKTNNEHKQSSNKKKNKNKTDNKSFDLASLIEAEQRSLRFKCFYEPAHFTEEKFQLYKKYQTMVHNDKPEDVTPQGFSNFLIQTPFSRDELLGNDEDWDILEKWIEDWKRDTPSKKSQRIGPTHECYYLDGKLIALSVIDFLPNSLSSVYFIWDPDYAHLSLGTLLSLREILMCHELGIPHYYLGYYISDCAKMRYKGKFGGELLDPCNQVFAPFDKVLPHIKNDQLWTLGNLESTTGDLREPELDLAGRPGVYSQDVTNNAQKIYGNEIVYETAQKVLDEFTDKIDLDEMDVPNVLPGAIPLRQTLEIFEKLNMELEIRVFIKEDQEKKKFKDLNPQQRCLVVEVVRMLGFEFLANRLVIILPE